MFFCSFVLSEHEVLADQGLYTYRLNMFEPDDNIFRHTYAASLTRICGLDWRGVVQLPGQGHTHGTINNGSVD